MKSKNSLGARDVQKPSDDALSKRQFLGLTTASIAGSLVATADAESADATNYDIIVVGGGTTGLPCAIFAAERGARVLVLEASSVVGGTLFLSLATLSAAGSKFQKSKGIVDTPQAHYEDVMRISDNTADPDLVHLSVFNAADTLDWLCDRGLEIGAPYPIFGPPAHDPYTVKRYQGGTKGGESILEILNRELEPHVNSGRIKIRTETEVTGLIQNRSGKVTGVTVKDTSGKTLRFKGRNVALTSGGYCSNSEMVSSLEGGPNYAAVAYPYARGAGIKLGLQAGGYVRGGEKRLPLFGVLLEDRNYPSGQLASVRPWPAERPPYEIWVNADGERFYQEDLANFRYAELSLGRQPGQRSWIIFDQTILDKAPSLVRGTPKDVIAKYFKSGRDMFYSADTVEALAKLANINAAGLQRTVAEYNDAVKNKRDTKFGRQHMPFPLVAPPFYALEIHGFTLVSFAGIAVNKELQVIRANGSAIPGLYAAGELLGAGQTMGNAYCSGMSATPALTLGRLLGQKLIPIGA